LVARRRTTPASGWRTFKGTGEPPATWTSIAFDDASWAAGPGKDARYASVYVRRVFSVRNPASVSSLSLSITYSGGFVAYLNGTEVARRKRVRHAARVDGDGQRQARSVHAETIDLSGGAGLLVAGTNVIAIQGHDVSTGSTGFSLVPELSVEGGSASLDVVDTPVADTRDGDARAVAASTLTDTCSVNADCNDGDSCTTDTCVSAGTTNTAALSFNGTSQYVRTADAAPELGTATFTVEAWIKWDGTTGAGAGTGGGGLTSAIPLVAKGRAQSEATNVDTNYFLGIDTATKRLPPTSRKASARARTERTRERPATSPAATT
jgi:hypothetical protein